MHSISVHNKDETTNLGNLDGSPALGSIPNLGPRPALIGSKNIPPPDPKGSRSPRPTENGSSGSPLKMDTNFKLSFSPLPDNKILDWSKMKQTADEILKRI